jgi:hypothetical protein
MALNLSHQTGAEFALRFWARVQRARRQGDQAEYHRLIQWLLAKIAAADITDAQARTAFNSAFGRALTAAQWTTLKTSRLQPMATRHAAMLAEGDL